MPASQWHHAIMEERMKREDLQALFGRLGSEAIGAFEFDVPLAKYSTWKIGGLADVLVQPTTTDQLCRLRQVIHEFEIDSVVIGNGSNLLIGNAGVQGVVVHLGRRFAAADFAGPVVTAQSGIAVPRLAKLAMSRGMSGIEHTIGIRGNFGGLICMNGGSQRKNIGSVLESVRAVDAAGRCHEYTADECEFAYRKSRFQHENCVIAEATLKLEAGSPQAIRADCLAILRSRRARFPLTMPNCGSVFVSDPKYYETHGPPGAIIESLGLKGTRIGDAEISQQHANFIVNCGQASSADVLQLIALVDQRVQAETGIKLKCEVQYLGCDGSTVPAHLIANGLAKREKPQRRVA